MTTSSRRATCLASSSSGACRCTAGPIWGAESWNQEPVSQGFTSLLSRARFLFPVHRAQVPTPPPVPLLPASVPPAASAKPVPASLPAATGRSAATIVPLRCRCDRPRLLPSLCPAPSLQRLEHWQQQEQRVGRRGAQDQRRHADPSAAEPGVPRDRWGVAPHLPRRLRTAGALTCFCPGRVAIL